MVDEVYHFDVGVVRVISDCIIEMYDFFGGKHTMSQCQCILPRQGILSNSPDVCGNFSK